VSFDTVTAQNNGWAGIAFYSRSSQNVDADISGVTFTGTTTITGNPYGIQFGGTGDTRGVQGANGGPVSLGIVAFSNNKYQVESVEYATNVIVSDSSVVQLDRASTVDGRAAASSDFPFAKTLTLVPSVSTTSTLAVSPSGLASTGTAVTITGSVSPSTAVGTIEIFDGTTRLGGGTATDGVFTVVTSVLRAGSHSLTAAFTPTNAGNYQASTSTAVSFSVNAPSVSTISTVTVSPSGSAIAGTTVTLTGTVSPSTALGTIEIFDGTTSLGEGTATEGVFTVETSALAVGDHSLTATFTPANAENFQASVSTAVTFSVNNAELSAVRPPAHSPVQVVVPVAQQRPVVTEQTRPPPPVTAQIVLTELGSSTAQLLEVYQAANNGDAPPRAAEVLTIAGGEIEAGTGAILSTTNFVASMPWSGSSDDQWVDVWAYSTPTHIGTFSVINGVLKITGADLSALAAGDHHLVLVGQTSGASEVMGSAIAEPASVPGDNVTVDPDGATPDVAAESQNLGWLLWVAIVTLAIAAIATIGTVVRRRRA